MNARYDQLRDAVRFLGRLLGDVIRAEDGEAVFDQIEEIRQASVAFHREGATRGGSNCMAARLSAAEPGRRRPLRPLLRLLPADHQHRRGPDPAPPRPRRRRAARHPGRRAARAGRRRASAPTQVPTLLARGADRAGDHRPPQRGPPQERARPPGRHRRRPRRAGPRPRPTPSARGSKRDLVRAGRRSSGAPGCCATCGSGVGDEIENAVSYFERSFLPEAAPALRPLGGDVLGRRRACPASCASAPGSAATATATPSSPPR